MDGVTHINVYSRGVTNLGKFLSNFTHFPIDLPEGRFNSIEGYWYWLGSGDDKLKKLYGFEAKKYGKTVADESKYVDDLEFKKKICEAIRLKIVKSSFLNEFRKSTLPFKHYYIFNNTKIEPKQFKWIVDYLEDLREELR